MNLLDMSFYASILIIAIVVVRALAIHRIPKWIFLLFWGIAIVRLLIPISVSIPISLPQQASSSATQILSENTLSIAGESASPFLVVWMLGLMVALTWYAVAYYRGYKELSGSLPISLPFVQEWLSSQKLMRQIQVRISDRISTPLTYGIIKPVIILPKNTDWNDENKLNYILTHELTHIRRFDVITKLILAVTVCIHWFNPLVWVMYILANRDIELSCDDAVSRKIGKIQRAAYAHALIDMSCPNKNGVMLFNNFSRYAIEERIEAITKKRQMSVFSTCMIAIIMALSIMAFVSSYDASDYDPLALVENIPGQVMEVPNGPRAVENIPGQNAIPPNNPHLVEGTAK